MKNICGFFLLAMIVFAVFLPSGEAQRGYFLTGTWKTEDGEVNITKSDQDELTATFTSGGDCPLGGKRKILFEAHLDGSTCHGIGMDRTCDALFSGLMFRCTTSKELLEECNLDSIYSVQFKAQGSDQIINGTFKNEHYSRKEEDKKDQDKSGNQNDNQHVCKWTRDPSGDSQIPFSLSRKNPVGTGGHSRRCKGKGC